MPLNIFMYGFLGGFLLDFVSYWEAIKEVQPEKATEESNESVRFWDYIYESFKVKRLLFCFVNAIIGGLLAWVINPQSALLAFYIGMTAYPTLSKFEAVLHVENKLA
jgi:predicted PurR-regulated permease PerM